MRSSVLHRCAGLAVWLLGLGTASASPPMVFSHLDASDGLPQNTVMATLQDSQGFVWFATEDGLSRYDGYEIRRYGRERNDPQALASSFVWSIAEDPNGDLWVATKDGGVARWLRHTDSFKSYRHDPADPGSLSSDSTRTLIIDRAGHVWVGTTGGGLNEIDPASGSIRRYRHDAARDDSLASDVVTALHEDAHGNLWVGTANGLQQLLRESGTFRRYGHSSTGPAVLSGQQISSIVEDRDGRLWIGTFDGGLNRLEPERGTITSWRARAEDPASLASDEVRALLADSAGRLWIGTSAGLHLIDRAGRLTRYVHDPAVPTSLPDDYVMSVYEDRAGLLWVGTRAAGASRWNPRSWAFGHQRPAWLGNSYVMTFADDAAGRLWVGTLGNGLHLFDPQTGAHQTLEEITGRAPALPDQRVMSLLTDRAGNLWIGTMGGGLARLSPDHELRIIRAQPDDPTALAVDGIMSMLEARDGRIWLGTFGGGVNILAPDTGLVRRISYDPRDAASIGGPRATALAEDNMGFVWVGTEGGGLNLFTADGRLLRVFRHAADDPSSLSADTVYSLHVDAHDQVWVGTDGGGLDRVIGTGEAPAEIRFQNFGKADGLASDIVYGIRSGATGQLWLSSNAGLTRYDPATARTFKYHTEQGTQGEDFNFGSHFRTRGGLLAFGGANGFNLFDPAALDDGVAPPALVLTRVEIMNRPARTAEPYPVLDELVLGHRDAVVSFEFAALDYAAPSKNRYQYRLKGFDQDWVDLAGGRRVSYTNLDAGHYVLEVRGASPESAWSDEALSLPVTMQPAPWLTLWAKTAYALLVVLLVLAIWRHQRDRLRVAAEAQAQLEQQVQERTGQLRERNAELARVSRAKSDFLSRMSHEIRTPLNGVVGTVELLCRTPLTPRQAQLADTVQNAARSLLTILNEILDLAKVEAGKTSLEARPFDLCAVLENTVVSLGPVAESKGLELYVAVPPDADCWLIGDSQRLGQVLLNLVGNAIKFTARGEVSVRADLVPIGDGQAGVKIAVKDTGIGMSPAVAARIFDPFSQADESTTRRYGGTGLGLSICREFVHLMGGTLAVTSQPGVGSTFTVNLTLPRATEVPAQPRDALRGLVVRLSCRRAALRDAIERQFAAWGVLAEWDDPRTQAAQGSAQRPPAAVWIIDTDVGDVNVDSLHARRDPASGSAIVLLAAPGAVVARGLEQRFGHDAIVLKPVQRDALYRALATATGRDHGLQESTAITAGVALQRLTGHVLVAEDNAVNSLVVEGMLQELGCTARVVSDGRSAVTQAVSERYDLVLMDVHMPELDGLSAARLIRQETSDGRRVPIIALTASSAEAHRSECLAAGMDDFLGKPFSFGQLHAVLRRYLPTAALDDAGPVTAAPAKDSRLDESVIARIQHLQRPDQPNLLRRVLNLYATNSVKQVAELQAAVAAVDLATVAKIAHALKSSSANVGASEVARLALALERAGLNHDTEAAHRAMSSLVATHAETLVWLNNLLEEDAA